MTALRPFHLAVTVNDLTPARQFYGQVLGCTQGRSDDLWTDYDFFGHQLVVHLDAAKASPVAHNPVDGHDVPVPHFGVVLTMDVWSALASKLQLAQIVFIIEPTIRFRGQPGEQATMFFQDPAGNALEFKAFADDAMLFATG
jgi:extradiol dioxygenase family protein